MSVINRMLQDLESRRDSVGPEGLARQIRAVPNRSHTTRWLLLLAGFVMVTAGLLWGWLHSRVEPSRASKPTRVRPRPDIVTTAPKVLATTLPAPVIASVVIPTPLAEPPTVPVFGLKPSLSLGLPGVPVPLVANNAPVSVRSSKANVIVASQSPPVAAPVAAPVASIPELRPTPVQPAPVKEITAKQRADNAYAAALTLIQEERTVEAAEQLGAVLQQDPGNSAARQTLSGLLIAAKRYDEAQRLLQDGLKIDPTQSRQAMLLARLQVEQGNVSAGLATLQRSLPAGADRADYQGFMAALLQREGRNREAIEHYQRALRKAPNSGAWLTGLGISLQSENRLAEARDAFERARASNSLDPELKTFVDQQLQH